MISNKPNKIREEAIKDQNLQILSQQLGVLCIVGNGIGDLSSNLGEGYLCFTSNKCP